MLLRHRFWGLLYRAAAWSAFGSLFLIGILFIAVLINFNLVFTTFHFISFANDLWMLDPRTDYLLIMFPQRFFFEATLAIAVMTAIEFAGLVVGAKSVDEPLRARGLAARPAAACTAATAASTHTRDTARLTRTTGSRGGEHRQHPG